MVAIVLMVAVFVGFMIWGWQKSGRDDSEGNDNPEEDEVEQQRRIEEGDPIESSQNDTNRLLRQIEKNTRRTKEVSEKFLFWFITLPLVIGAIILIIQGCD